MRSASRSRFSKEEVYRAVKKNLRLFNTTVLLQLRRRIERFNFKNADVAFKLLTSKAGMLTFSFNGRRIHSVINPRKEAALRLQSRLEGELRPISELVVLGCDFLYELEALCERIHSANRPLPKLYLAIEEEIIFYKLLVHRNLDFLAQFKRKIVLIFPGDALEKKLSAVQVGNVFFIETAVGQQRSPFLRKVKTFFNQRVVERLSAFMTQLYFERTRLKNYLNNYPFTPRAHRLEELLHFFRGESAYLIAAGPSLYKKLPEIKQLKHGVIISVDSALPVLLAAGITPNFVVSLDPGYANTFDFLTLPPKATYLIAHRNLHPYITRNFKGKIFFYQCEGEHLDAQSALTVKRGGSVAVAMLDIAIKIGFSSLVLYGFDFQMHFWEPHVVSTMHFNHDYQLSTRLASLETKKFERAFYSLSASNLENFTFSGEEKSFCFSSFYLKKYAIELAEFIREVHKYDRRRRRFYLRSPQSQLLYFTREAEVTADNEPVSHYLPRLEIGTYSRLFLNELREKEEYFSPYFKKAPLQARLQGERAAWRELGRQLKKQLSAPPPKAILMKQRREALYSAWGSKLPLVKEFFASFNYFFNLAGRHSKREKELFFLKQLYALVALSLASLSHSLKVLTAELSFPGKPPSA